MSDEQTTTDTVSVKPKKSSSISLLLTLLVAIIAFVGMLFLWQQNLSKSNTLANLTDRINALHATTLIQQKAQGDLQQSVNTILQQQNQLAAIQRWQTAGQLLQLANVQYVILHQPNTSLKLLAAAATTLSYNKNSAAQTVLNAIAIDTSAIQPLLKMDTAQQLTSLNQLMAQVESMQVVSEKQFHPEIALDRDSSDNWWGHLKHNLKNLENLVVIRHINKPIEPLLAPQQFELLKSVLRAQLTLAQLAVMNHDQAAYTVALANIKEWINRYAGQNKNSLVILNEIDALTKQPIFDIKLSTLKSWQVWQQSNKDDPA